MPILHPHNANCATMPDVQLFLIITKFSIPKQWNVRNWHCVKQCHFVRRSMWIQMWNQTNQGIVKTVIPPVRIPPIQPSLRPIAITITYGIVYNAKYANIINMFAISTINRRWSQATLIVDAAPGCQPSWYCSLVWNMRKKQWIVNCFPVFSATASIN